MSGFTRKDGVLHADNIPLSQLAQTYGTPAYIYSASQIRQNVTALQDAMKKALPENRQPLIAFACKANSNIAVLALLAGMGLGSDIVSGGELQRVLKAGISADKVVYSGVGKSDEELRAAIESDILQINVESKAELERIAAIAEDMNAKPRVAFRLNPDVEAKTHDKISTGRREDKFGLVREEIEELYEWAAKNDHLQPYGLQTHIGSQLTDTDPFYQAYEKLADLATFLKLKDLPLENLDLGGGLGITYKDETPPDLDAYAKIINDVILPLETKITLEPGRYITGNAGLLLTKISYIKEHDDQRFIILDAGMNDLIRPALYDAHHNIELVERTDGDATKYDVVGPVCESSDIFIKGMTLPSPQKDDLVAIMTAGAYGFVMASNYNTRPLPPEIMIDGDNHTIIRQKQSVQDIIEKETIPDWLT